MLSYCCKSMRVSVALLCKLRVIYLIYIVSYGCVAVMLVYWSEYLNEWGSRNYRYGGTTRGGGWGY